MPSLKMIAELNKYHGLPNGMFSCDEHLAGRDPSQGSELCTVVESMFSLEQSLAITGDAALGDRLEKLAFNALPGTFTDDMWAHQYNQEPNQVECSLHHKPWVSDGPESNLYGLEPNFGCCTANFSQGWPKFTASLFMLSGIRSDADAGLVAAAYAPCEVRTILRGIPVHVIEETDYPFRGTIRLTVNPASPLELSALTSHSGLGRDGTAITVNGQPWMPAPAPRSFARLRAHLESRRPRRDHLAHAAARLPLVSTIPSPSSAGRWFSLTASAKSWVKLRDRGMTADWQVFPTTPWNYALECRSGIRRSTIVVAETELWRGAVSRKSAPSVS